MLFWIVLGVFAISLAVFAIAMYKCWNFNYSLSGVVCGASMILVVIMLFVLIVNHVGLDGQIAEKHARYNAISYQLNCVVNDPSIYYKGRELWEDIQAWNEDLAYYKANQDDFWIGIFIPNIYDEFEFFNLFCNCGNE